MTTKIYRNHYGLIAESVFGYSLYKTFRRYNRDTVTSLSTIEKDEGGVRISHPENISYTHLFTGKLTQKKLAELHKDGVEKIVRKYAAIS